MPNPSAQFVAFFPDAILHLCRLKEDEALHVLIALAKHADAFGGCDPGDSLLGDLTGHRRDRIPDLLGRLQALDYLHVIMTCVPWRQQPLRGFQISPYVLRLRPENQFSAIAAWQDFKASDRDVDNIRISQGNEKPTTLITYGENDQQPESDLEPDQKQIQNSSKPEPKQAPPALSHEKTPLNGKGEKLKADSPAVVTAIAAQNPDDGEEETRSPDEGGAVEVPAARGPEPVKLASYRRALASPEDENLALDLVNLCGDMSRENARMLVDTYHALNVESVIALYKLQHGAIQHPARWVRAMLRKQAGASIAAAAADRNKYISGKYSEYVEH